MKPDICTADSSEQDKSLYICKFWMKIQSKEQISDILQLFWPKIQPNAIYLVGRVIRSDLFSGKIITFSTLSNIDQEEVGNFNGK